eukprot:scaffold2.g7513.t1
MQFVRGQQHRRRAQESQQSSASLDSALYTLPSGEKDAEVVQLRRAVEHLKSLNADLQAEIAQVVRSLSVALDSIPALDAPTDQQLQDASAAAGATAAAATDSQGGPPVYHQPTEVAQARLSCSVPHPGALCCTKTAVTEVDGAFVINMSTTARATRSELNPEDLAAIGARALECAAVDFSHSRSAAAQARVLSASRRQRHNAICSILQDGRVLTAEHNPVQSSFGHESYVLMLEHPATGQRLRALFKPRVSGDADGWHRAPIEVVAYRLNLLLGFDYVPPCVYRTGGVRLPVDGDWVEFDEGAAMLWVAEAKPMEQVPCGADAFLSDTRILDVLIHNSDRHRGHFLCGRHWAVDDAAVLAATAARNGDCHAPIAASGPPSPVLIDHAAGFRREAYVIMEHENAFCTGPVLKVRASTYLRLRLLDRHTCQQQFGEFLNEQEIREMLHRRNYMLRYLDNLVAKQGFEATVLEGH